MNPFEKRNISSLLFTDAPLVSVSPAAPSYVEGDTVEVTCAVDSEPLASVLWYRAGSGHIMSRQPLLRLDQVTREQAGEYVCSANNSVGTSQPDSVNIVVQCKCLISPIKTFMPELQTTSYFHFPPPESQVGWLPERLKSNSLTYFLGSLGESKHRLIPRGL